MAMLPMFAAEIGGTAREGVNASAVSRAGVLGVGAETSARLAETSTLFELLSATWLLFAAALLVARLLLAAMLAGPATPGMRPPMVVDLIVFAISEGCEPPKFDERTAELLSRKGSLCGLRAVRPGWDSPRVATAGLPGAAAGAAGAAEDGGAAGCDIVVAAVVVSAVLAGVFEAVVKLGRSSRQGCHTARPIMTTIIAARAAQRNPRAQDRAAGLSTTCSSCN